MRRHTLFCLCFAYLLIIPALISAQEAAKRAPVPNDTAEAEAMKLVKEVYGQEWASAKNSEKRKILAEKLISKAAESREELANCYVLLRLGRDIAALAGDADLTFRAIDRMAAAYDVDSYLLKIEILPKVTKSIVSGTQYTACLQLSMSLVDQAVAKSDFDSANQVLDCLTAAARKSTNKSESRAVSARKSEVAEMTQAYSSIKPALAVLEKEPTDPAANLTVGTFTCFQKGDWSNGIAMLALGKDEELKSLATRELKGSSDPKDQLALGDDWWQVAEKKDEGTIKNQLRQRAGYWYKQALPGLTGLSKAKVEMRLKDPAISVSTAAETSTDLPKSASANEGTQAAIRAGLRWLERQQARDGSWSIQSGLNPGTAKAPAGATGLALLSFLRAGQTQKSGEHKQVVAKGLACLMQIQRENGDLSAGGPQMYSHGVASVALCEAYARTRDARLQFALRRAVSFIVNAQNASGGWRYTASSRDADTCVVGWQLTALATAREAGVAVPQSAFGNAGRYLSMAQFDGGARYGYMPGTGASPCMTAVGLLCRTYLGWDGKTPALRSGIAYLTANSPASSPHNVYHWYYAARLMQRAGGEESKRWCEALQARLIREQEKDGGLAGSWWVAGEQWGSQFGRLGNTCFSLIILGSLQGGQQ